MSAQNIENLRRPKKNSHNLFLASHNLVILCRIWKKNNVRTHMTYWPQNAFKTLVKHWMLLDEIQSSKRKRFQFRKKIDHINRECNSTLRTMKIGVNGVQQKSKTCQKWSQKATPGLGRMTENQNTIDTNFQGPKWAQPIPVQKNYIRENKHKSQDLFGDDSPVVVKKRRASRDGSSPEIANDTFSAVDIASEIANFTVSPQGSPTPRDPPEPEELIQALQELENNAATVDATIREKIASLPLEVSDVSMLSKLQGNLLVLKHPLSSYIIGKLKIILRYIDMFCQNMENLNKKLILSKER
ncbi:unnamed protein product, partial [Meganyctiphanes norvegica]